MKNKIILGAVVVAMAGAIAVHQLGWFNRINSGEHPGPGQVVIQRGVRLQDIVIGVPQGRAGVAEARTAFAPDEDIILHGVWDRESGDTPVTWEWFGPDGSMVYWTSMDVKKDWVNTWSSYRGPKPLAAGAYTVRLTARGTELGCIGFQVVRNVSEIPVRVLARAFRDSKVNRAQATAIAMAVRAVAAGDKRPQEAVASLDEAVLVREIGLAVSLYQSSGKVLAHLGSGERLEEALASCLTAVAGAKTLEPEQLTVELSILHSGLQIPARTASVNAQLSGNTGFSLAVNDKRATLLPSVIFKLNLLEAVDILRQVSIDAGLGESGYRDDGAQLTAFKSQEFVLHPGVEMVREMLNGRAVVHPAELTFESLEDAIERAINWYIENQHPRGNYMYSFLPARNESPQDDWCLRVLNAVFVMTELAIERPDRSDLRESVERAINLYKGALRSTPDGKGAFVDWKEPRPDSGLGSTAFLLGATAMLGRAEDQLAMKRMANAILAEQEDSGRFSTSFVGPDRDVDQQYSPGEAMLALVRYYGASKDERALDAVEKAYPHYRSYWRREKHGPFVPWQIRTYMELHRLRPKDEYPEYVFDLMDWMLQKMPPLPISAGLAKAGAFERMFASTGVYTEGLCAAFQMAEMVGDRGRAGRYAKALVGCVRYIVGLQYKETDVYPFDQRTKVLGAIAMKPRNNELRLDFTYHGISALHMVTQSLDAEQWNALRAAAFPYPF